MGAVKKYFKREFQKRRLKFEYENGADFYLGCFHKSQSSVPLLIVRALLFFLSVSIVVSSIVLIAKEGNGGYWPIYMTHWGILMMMISTGLGFAVSLISFMNGSIDCADGLPWYIKLHWIISNITVPLALFITIFYWTLLIPLRNNPDYAEIEFSPNQALDVLVHAINSVVMVLFLLTSRQPVFILHFYQVFCFALLYLFFSVIYWAAGGTDPFGNPFVYPMLNWNKPDVSIIAVVFCAVLIIVIHVAIAFVALARDAITRKLRKENSMDMSSSNLYA